MSQLIPPNWEHIRDVWESDPTLSYGELAKKFMLSKNTIYARSKRENWQRTGNVVDLAKEATRRVNAKANESNEAESVKSGQEEAIDRRVAATEKHVEQLAKLDAIQDSRCYFGSADAQRPPDEFTRRKYAKKMNSLTQVEHLE